MFSYAFSLDNKLAHTKLTILSDISKIFDPLGWISPSTILAKLIMQELWLKQAHWYTPLTPEIKEKCLLLREQLPILSEIKINRWLNINLNDSVLNFMGMLHMQR